MKVQIIFACSLLGTTTCLAQTNPTNREQTADRRSSATAPAMHMPLQSVRGGAYFIPVELDKRRREVEAQIAQLKASIDRRELSATKAAVEIANLQSELDELLESVKTDKVFVSAFEQFTQTDRYEFEFGTERLLVIRADQVAIESWDGDKIQCILEKSILAKLQPEAVEFAAIHIEHSLAVDSELVGKTPQQLRDEDRLFRESVDGRQLNAAALAARAAFIEELIDYRKPFSEFQGKPINVIKLSGLLGDQGNYQVTSDLRSPDGGAQMSSSWSRQAKLTVKLPKCNKVAVLGCLSGVAIRNTNASLLLTNSEAHDRDYSADYYVDGVHGDVHIINVPVRRIENVVGNLRIDATDEMRNGGNRHDAVGVNSYSDAVPPTKIEAVSGDLVAHYVQADLHISGVDGRVDVFNEYGTTSIVLAEKMAAGAQRIVSHAGAITVQISQELLSQLPIQALTQVGNVQVNVNRSQLEELSFSSAGRAWRGFVSPVKERDFAARFSRLERAQAAWAGAERTPGLDVLSGSSAIKFESR